jgi:hypothetical protein
MRPYAAPISPLARRDALHRARLAGSSSNTRKAVVAEGVHDAAAPSPARRRARRRRTVAQDAWARRTPVLHGQRRELGGRTWGGCVPAGDTKLAPASTAESPHHGERLAETHVVSQHAKAGVSFRNTTSCTTPSLFIRPPARSHLFFFSIIHPAASCKPDRRRAGRPVPAGCKGYIFPLLAKGAADLKRLAVRPISTMIKSPDRFQRSQRMLL